jgi:hypothetical protein
MKATTGRLLPVLKPAAVKNSKQVSERRIKRLRLI